MPEVDAAYYFRGGRLRSGLDFTNDYELMRAVILEWFQQHPGPQNLTAAKDAANCGDSVMFDKLVRDLVDGGLLRYCFLSRTLPLYNHAAVTVDGWLKATARRQEAACAMKEASDASD